MNLPDFSYEWQFWKQGQIVVGADEVGRGALAGPVVAAAVIFRPGTKIEVEINDSKKLSPKKREEADRWIRKNAVTFAIGQASVLEINSLGISKALNRAYRRAIFKLEADYLLVDGFNIPYLRGFPQTRQLRLIKGDQQSLSIAAASVVAKVHRDNLITKLSQHPALACYDWSQNKGYGTLKHRKAIKKYGICKLHRRQFVSNLI